MPDGRFAVRSDFGAPDEKWWPVIARRCRCPKVGQCVQLGDVVSLGIEPYVPYGRVVGLTRKKVFVRAFRKTDTWFPTGEIHMGSVFASWCPWLGAGEYR